MSGYFRMSADEWEPEHYRSRWTPENRAPRWWAWLRALRAGYAGSELMTLAADAIERGDRREEKE